jgi:hypothetical protein
LRIELFSYLFFKESIPSAVEVKNEERGGFLSLSAHASSFSRLSRRRSPSIHPSRRYYGVDFFQRREAEKK